MARPDFDRKPGYWAACKKMGFDELGAFIRASVREPPGFGRGPRTKQALLELLELLARKGGLIWSPGDGDRVWENKDLARHRKLQVERERARRSLSIAEDGVPREMRVQGETTKRVLKERRNLTGVERQTLLLEKKVREYEDEPQAPRAVAAGEGAGSKQPKTRQRRVVAVLLREIEGAFLDGDDPSDSKAAPFEAKRLPWRVLPEGELTLERVLSHYDVLGRARSDVRYEPERIRRAYSLGPDGCYVGADEFEGYIVFTFPRTGKALLECPVWGNAIYVLGPDWRRLSRLSKPELLSGRTRGVTKIVHRGEWFARTRRALGLR